MSITLSPDTERLIAQKVDEGHYKSADELVRKALELLPRDTALESSKELSSVADVLTLVKELTRDIPESEWEKVPRDLAQNVDHYLYGHPKQS
jgi:putative addiction module CopG family antidote